MELTRRARTASHHMDLKFATRVTTCYAVAAWTWKSLSASPEPQCSANVASSRRLCPPAPHRRFWQLWRWHQSVGAVAAASFTPEASVERVVCGVIAGTV